MPIGKKKNVVLITKNRYSDEFPYRKAEKLLYLSLLSDELQKGNLQLYISVKKFFKDKKFQKAWKFQNGQWKRVENIRAHVVYDKTASIGNKGISKKYLEIAQNVPVVNSLLFKRLMGNKINQIAAFKEFMPKTMVVSSNSEFEKSIKKIKTKTVVMKPFFGKGGKGVVICSKEDAQKRKPQFPFMMQSYINGYGKVPGTNEKGIYDIRFVYTSGKVSFCISRCTNSELKLTNINKGARPILIKKKDLPKSLLEVAEKISKRLSVLGHSQYSLDFMMDQGRPFLIEINTRPGGVSEFLYKKQHSLKKELALTQQMFQLSLSL